MVVSLCRLEQLAVILLVPLIVSPSVVLTEEADAGTQSRERAQMAAVRGGGGGVLRPPPSTIIERNRRTSGAFRDASADAASTDGAAAEDGDGQPIAGPAKEERQRQRQRNRGGNNINKNKLTVKQKKLFNRRCKTKGACKLCLTAKLCAIAVEAANADVGGCDWMPFRDMTPERKKELRRDGYRGKAGACFRGSGGGGGNEGADVDGTSPARPDTATAAEDPTSNPSKDPTKSPTDDPTQSPTEDPTKSPTDDPTVSPTADPTHSPACVFQFQGNCLPT